MSILIASGTTISIAAYTTSAELVTGQYQYIGKGRLTLAATTSAIGMNLSLSINGIPLVSDLPCPFVRATALLSINDHVVVSQVQKTGGYVSFKLRNTSAGALTSDYQLLYDPM